jgi:hypothetical protein
VVRIDRTDDLPRKATGAVPATRKFPLDEPATGAKPAPRWTVLARIDEVNRASQEAPTPSTRERTNYRVDAAHAAVAPAPASSLQRAATPAHVAPAPAPQQDRVLRAAPLPIRVALEAWQWIQPHQKLLRLAAMLALMSAGGMAMLLIMNGRPRVDGQSAAPAMTATDTAAIDAALLPKLEAPKLEVQHAELDRALVPTVGPAADVDTDLLEPTAAGPLRPMSTPLMAVEKEEPLPTLPYPTTLRPEPLDPILADESLPQARFEEPSVARLKGFIVDSQVR